MTSTLKQAIAAMERLPAATQERIGEELLQHLQKVARLRLKLATAAQSLDHGDGKELHIKEVIKRARAQYGRSR